MIRLYKKFRSSCNQSMPLCRKWHRQKIRDILLLGYKDMQLQLSWHWLIQANPWNWNFLNSKERIQVAGFIGLTNFFFLQYTRASEGTYDILSHGWRGISVVPGCWTSWLVCGLTGAQMEERSKQGFCYNCDEKWQLGHKCKGAKFFFIGGFIFVNWTQSRYAVGRIRWSRSCSWVHIMKWWKIVVMLKLHSMRWWVALHQILWGFKVKSRIKK